MAKDNLLLFPKKSKPVLDMTEKELRWAISGTLVLIFTLSLGLNGAIFNGGASEPDQEGLASNTMGDTRAMPLASVRIDWENRALEVLGDQDRRDIASVGKSPSLLEELSLGDLEGLYEVETSAGRIAKINFSNGEGRSVKTIDNRLAFLKKHQALWGGDVTEVRPLPTTLSPSEERYELLSRRGQTIGHIRMRLDGADGLLSLSVE